MDEEFFLEDVEDEMDEEEDLALGAAEDDIVFADVEDHDGDDLPNEFATKQLDFIYELNKDNRPVQRMTKMAMRVLFQFLCTYGIEINIGTCTNQELAEVLKKFFLKVRKSDGEMYKKNAFGCIKFGLMRGIREMRKDFNFSYGAEFRIAVQAFKHTMRQLRCLGKTVDHIVKITMDDLEKLYSGDTFDVNRPTSLQNKVLFEILFFMMCSRGRRNLRNLQPSNFAIKWNEKGRKYVQIVDNSENLNEGFDNQQVDCLLECTEVSSDPRPKGGCIFALPGNPKCPVAAIEKYLSKLPPQTTYFFPQPGDRHRYGVNFQTHDTWYLNSALGKNSLGAAMKEISKQAELSKSYSNFCIHATGVSILNLKGYNVKNYLESRDVGEWSRISSVADELEMLERMSDVLSKTIIPEEGESSNSSSSPPGLHTDLRKDIHYSNTDCSMYLVPMQSIPDDEPTQIPVSCIPPQGPPPRIQVLTVPPATYSPQNPTPQVFLQPVGPQTQFKNAVRIQPFGTRGLMQKKIQFIAPKAATCSPTVPQHTVQAIGVQQNSGQTIAVPQNSGQTIPMAQNSGQTIAVPQNSLQPGTLRQRPLQVITMPQNQVQAVTIPNNSQQATSAPQVIIKAEPTYSQFTSGTWHSTSAVMSSAVPSTVFTQTQGATSSMASPVTQIFSRSLLGGGASHGIYQNIHVSKVSNDSQASRIQERLTDNTTQQTSSNQSINHLQSELKQKDQLLQETKKRVNQLELYQGEYKRLLQESTILQQHMSNNQAKIKELTNKIDTLKKTKQNAIESKNSYSFEQLCCNKPLFRHYTGYTPEEFQMLFQFLIPDTSSGPYKGKGHNLSLRSQLLMTLSKLKNNFSFIDLGQRYYVSKVMARNMFQSWLCHMSEKFEDVYVWPHRETLKAQLPRHFQQDFPNTLAIFKRIKVRVSLGQTGNERVSLGEMGNERHTCGNNRHGIIAVDPRGCILGCSGLVSGILTDSELFRKSGMKSQLIKLMDAGRLQKNDGILSENLDIDSDLIDIGLKLNDVSYSKCDIDDDLKDIIKKQRVQTHKIIIDKAVNRLKKFLIISHVIPTTLSSSSDKILQVVAFLTNFLPPLSIDVC